MPYVGMLSQEEGKKFRKKLELDRVLGAAPGLAGERQFVIGGQSLAQKCPDLSDEILMSAEVDLMPKSIRIDAASRERVRGFIGADFA